ncbi:fatty acid desaturase [Myxococcus llanfairpwllgwyngyllgogerychwyrndrobwllllantysiliogogogochensis]|uniref:Fatty acid desaturase n=1 Tax=Myxococcus llanfairpwllgwyngyllgogerychwyrndrobwllllantysiliogogogochensis TaxID=2590453 RepID=A0A540WLU6_9BACT|nr:fatty acid desaturase [Myxococcus llanfairpwllgwyngyllgogerychwyrndrobwllllantysiliogogogochensis]TQF09975.1 fatty acid desaturase [Myxococcus llanfairpwllgwyngyllgogerychwyrndrobwllllantysiliogogogochensis]
MENSARYRSAPLGPWGVLVALVILGAWGTHLSWMLLSPELPWDSPLTWLHVALQAWLCTGLFITGHDAMHGTVARQSWVNETVGTVACFLFAGLSYRRLVLNHHAHHEQPTGDADPDFSTRTQSFWPWLGTFMARYTTLPQLGVMAAKFNIFVFMGVSQPRILAFWVLPAVLGTLQLFYFGTYQPHRRPETPDMAPHHARTLPRNHLWAMLSCFFFGYHWEHHQSPGTPWWRLWRVKDARADASRAAASTARDVTAGRVGPL